MTDPTPLTASLRLLVATANSQRVRAENLAKGAYKAAREAQAHGQACSTVAEECAAEAEELSVLLADAEQWEEGDQAAYADRVCSILQVANERRMQRIGEQGD